MVHLHSWNHHSQDSLDHCLIAINADQNCVIDPNADRCRLIPLNFSPFLSMPDQEYLILLMSWSDIVGNDRHWSALRGIDWHWAVFRINAIILIGIDRHWAIIKGILYFEINLWHMNHTLSQIYPHWNWISKLNTKLRLEFQVEYGFKLEF